jgi:hypothetical protein
MVVRHSSVDHHIAWLSHNTAFLLERTRTKGDGTSVGDWQLSVHMDMLTVGLTNIDAYVLGAHLGPVGRTGAGADFDMNCDVSHVLTLRHIIFSCTCPHFERKGICARKAINLQVPPPARPFLSIDVSGYTLGWILWNTESRPTSIHLASCRGWWRRRHRCGWKLRGTGHTARDYT